MEYTLGLIFAFLAMIGFGVSNFVVQPLTKRMPNDPLIVYRNILLSLVIGCFCLVGYFFSWFTFSFSWKMVGIALLVALVGYLPYLTFLRALRKGKVSIVVAVTNSTLLFTALFAWILYGEQLSSKSYLGIIIIFAGLLMVSLKDFSLKQKAEILAKGVGFALLTSVLWGFMFVLWKIPANGLGPMLSAFFLEFGLFIWAGIAVLLRRQKMPKPSLDSWSRFLIIGFSTGIATTSTNVALTMIPASLIAPIVYSQSAVVALLSRVFYKEQLMWRQYLGIVVLIVGMFVLARV